MNLIHERQVPFQAVRSWCAAEATAAVLRADDDQELC